ncbi:SusC/RagA family TonB-linked outer membrane protein [Mucilaginibacter sp. BJC16-A38]|uniref:SusC/RagA family TonB-linked outer membrane protein n=1 Tax=Mucilaginibacter phenanthrenivorans TaxID=1234842 RepID=UPI002157B75E|nr:SusC/RagA family TonB-linked outer membrane protein [Mucilaginibacter phenanthrenivorans]MCR8560002.1 SusC/RagA family TonB-linked outer membrane protein [Mucilaginibacter phenanthrenivorans]
MRKNLYFQKFASVLQNIVATTAFLLLLSRTAAAQTSTGITVTGKVTDAQTNETLVGVTVGIKGTTKGVFTDGNGTYSITADPAATLVFTYIGYKRTEVAVGGKTKLDVKLPPSSEQLKDVVVTALGIKKERRALGYSVTEVKGSSLTEARDNNFVNGLEGKVAGVNVSGVSTGPGGSANVVIRGISDITGSNQPLYVIDGVPMTNGTSRQTDSQGYGGVDGGDETININPDDIETISVLKGAAASALYGYRGSKGVILITTKSGKNAKGTGVELNSNFVITSVIDNTDWQTTYGQGSNQQKPIDGPSAFETGLSAWGAKLDGKMVYQFDGVKRPYSEVANGNMGRFYKNGTHLTNTVSFSKNIGDDGSVRFSASDLHDNSIIPNAGYKQQSFTLSANYKLDKHLDLQLKAQYIYAYTHNRPSVSDAPGNLNFATEFLPPNVNITTLAPGYKADGSENQFLDDPYTTNPYFAAYKFINNTSRNRFIGSGDLKYTFDNGLYLQLRAGEDYFADRNTSVTPNGTAYEPTGDMTEENQKSSELNIDAIVGKEFKVTKDFNVTALLGANSRRYVVDQIDAGGANFATPYLYTIGNLLYPRESTYNPVTVNKSIYGTLDFAYKNFLYLSATGRNDWYSTLAPGKKINYFYPSLSGSFVFSELIHIPGMDLGKLRIGYANVGGEADSPYQTLLGYNNIGNLYGHPIGNISNGGTVPNALLEPSSAKELEIGTELSFANSRLHFDIAYYNKKESREVIPATISESSGYTNVILNSGVIQNKGLEFLVSGSPIKTKDFTWTESLNVSYNNNKVLALVTGLGNIPTGSSSRAGEDENVSVAYIGQTIGKSAYQIYVADPQRDANGKIVIDPGTGAPAQGTNYVDAGSAISPWTTGITSELRYKHFNFSFLLDGKFGGKIFSGTEWYGYNFGLSKATLPGRDKLYGDQQVFAQTYYQTIAANNPAIFIYDASFIKFRQLIFGYTFPTSLFNNKIQAINLSFVARNLFTIMKHTPDIDPESNYSNGPQGIEQATVPYTRTFGFNLNVKF